MAKITLVIDGGGDLAAAARALAARLREEERDLGLLRELVTEGDAESDFDFPIDTSAMIVTVVVEE